MKVPAQSAVSLVGQCSALVPLQSAVLWRSRLAHAPVAAREAQQLADRER